MFQIADVWEKIKKIDSACEETLAGRPPLIPEIPARDILVMIPEKHPDKKGLSYREGQARLLHDLANIELQAMELALRTLVEFPEAPAGFREELAALTVSESQHLRMCLQGLEKLEHAWGFWPIHTVLWRAVSSNDSLLDRILIVHRYLEGSGLDAGDTLLRRLDAVAESAIHPILKTIFSEEVGHVEFGSRWYREICRMEGIDPQEDFPLRMQRLKSQLPKRIEKICRPSRLRAGFTLSEIEFLEDWRERSRQQH
ncbi:MAG: DUF455 domain-containing protein [Bdellovibrio sp. CG10_big_fil_rev_8_21_14_0_10_47_8]|nr:MAG: DUF455 domain-containing protein [Bdellovibrio sp. CG10_big_fil_rev_8_21_14_0_10_47_8]